MRPTGETASKAAHNQDTAAPAAEMTGPARGTGWAAAAARYAPVLAAAAAMAWLGQWGLARFSAMGNDETASRWAASLSLRQLAHLLRHVDAVHGLYYLLLHAWLAVGTSPAVLRIPSVIGAVAAAALTVILARRLTGSGWAGLFAGLIMAVTTSVSFYTQTARSYALVSACVVGQTLALVSVLEAEQATAERSRIRRGWLIYGALVTLGGYLNEMALLVLVAHAVTIAAARPGRRVLWHWAVAAAIGTALVGPVLALSIAQHGSASWIGRPKLYQVRLLYHDYFGATSPAALLVGACAVAGALPPWRWRKGSDSIPLSLVAVPLLLLPAGVLIVQSLVTHPLYQDRYVQYGEAAAALLAGAGVYRIGRWLAVTARRPELIVVPGVAACVGALVLQLSAQQGERSPQSRSFNFGGPAFYVGNHAHRGDGVLFLNSFYRKAELGYPDEFRKTIDFALAVPPAAAASYQGIDKQFAAIRPLMLSHRRIWVIGDLPSPALPAGPMRDESLVLQRDFTRVTVHSYKGIWLTLWIRRGSSGRTLSRGVLTGER